MDVELAENALDQLAQEQYEISDDWKEHHFVGTYTTSNENTTVLTTLPYDEGWKIYVDGKEIEYTKALDALIAFEMEGVGEHTLEMKYAPKTFTLGLTVSVLSLILFVLIMVCEKPLALIWSKLITERTSNEGEHNAPEKIEDADEENTDNNSDTQNVTTEE
jgi:uncharacterized membrane protein YfhO